MSVVTTTEATFSEESFRFRMYRVATPSAKPMPAEYPCAMDGDSESGVRRNRTRAAWSVLLASSTVANEAVAKLWYQGLLRGHPCKPYYEAADGVGYLLYALLQLDQAVRPGQAVRLPMENW